MNKILKYVDWKRIVRAGTVDFPYEDTWEETVEETTDVYITPQVLADFMNPKWRKMTLAERNAYIEGIDDMMSYAYDFISDFIDTDDDFQEHLQKLAAENWNENNRK